MKGTLRHFNPLQAPYIQIKVKTTSPGETNGKPNIKEENKYVLAPSAKKIGTYIKNQLFGSDLLTQTEGLDINWLTPTLSKALELSVYERESFVYIHLLNDKVYLECINKCDIHNLVQEYDIIKSCDIIQDFKTDKFDYSLKRHIELVNGTTELTFIAYKKDSEKEEYYEISINEFNSVFDTDYKRFYLLPYEVIVNIDIGQDFFKDSVKFLNEEMEVYNTLCEEVEKTKTRIVTSQHYQTNDIYGKWTPMNNMYDIKSVGVNGIADLFTLLPGDKEHQIFDFLQGNLRQNDYIDIFKFCDYQIIQMANLSPASFGYEKDKYQNVASVDLSMNLTEMTIEAIKKQIEPQVNKLIENIIKLQEAKKIEENKIPNDIQWDYGNNEKLDDDKKISVLKSVESVIDIPYQTRAKIVAPIINKLIDEDVSSDSLVNEYNKEKKDLKIDYEEF